jgi:hypothetical protein
MSYLKVRRAKVETIVKDRLPSAPVGYLSMHFLGYELRVLAKYI